MLPRKRMAAVNRMGRRDPELESYIRECAAYILERRRRSATPRTARVPSTSEAEQTLADFDRVIVQLIKADRGILRIREREDAADHFQISGRLETAARSISSAMAACLDSQHDLRAFLRDHRGNAETQDQLSACRLAIGYFNDPDARAARGVATRIMLESGTPEPARRTFTERMKQARVELHRMATSPT